MDKRALMAKLLVLLLALPLSGSLIAEDENSIEDKVSVPLGIAGLPLCQIGTRLLRAT